MNTHALLFHADTTPYQRPAAASTPYHITTSASNSSSYYSNSQFRVAASAHQATSRHHRANHRANLTAQSPQEATSISDCLAMSNATIQYYLSPKRRLDTLFTIHAAASLLIGALGFLFPSAASVFFSTETEREFRVSRAILRPYCSLILAQGLIIWRARKINDGEIKRAFVQAYFVCFLMSTLSLIAEHIQNSGVVSGKLLGVFKILAMIGLTAGYGWFTFFQPPSVFTGLGMTRSHYH